MKNVDTDSLVLALGTLAIFGLVIWGYVSSFQGAL